MQSLYRVILGGWLLLLAMEVGANHSYGGLDLCALYPETMPPGLPAELLPEATSQGAALMQQYCTQCHALPGPGHHTAAEWEPVLAKMILLMEVANQFGGLMGRVQAPDRPAQQQLQQYLTQYALKPLLPVPQGVGAAAFTTHCGACHAVPDMTQYQRTAWPQLLTRMQHNRQVMRYPLLSNQAQLQIHAYLQLETMPQLAVGTPLDTPAVRGQGWAVGAFLLLVIVSLGRWYWRSKGILP